MNLHLKDFLGKVVIYYSRSKGDLTIGYVSDIVRHPQTKEKALLVDNFMTGQQTILRRMPKILTLELYELQNKMKFRLYFLLKMMGFQDINNDIIKLDKTIKEYIRPEMVMHLEARLYGAKNPNVRIDIKLE